MFLTRKQTLIRRNLLSTTVDETFASRYIMPELNEMFLYPNQVITLEEEKADNLEVVEKDLEEPVKERRPKLIFAQVQDAATTGVVDESTETIPRS